MEITTLKNLYDKYSIKDGIKHVKDILIIKPDISYDIKPDLLKMKISKHEVCVTWPREGFPILNEIALINANHVIQVGKPISRKFWSLDINGLPNLTKKPDAFVSLHHHDEYSLRDGLGKMEDLIALLKSQKRNYCSVTNHGSLGGWVKQYIQCKDAGIKPIFGSEMYWSPNRDPDPEKRKEFSGANHLLMLAINNDGFYNLIKIHNDAQLNGFYRTPRTNDEAIIKWGSGLVSSSTCFSGDLPSLLWKWDSTGDIQFYNKAIERYEFYKAHFSKFYIELPFVEFPDQVKMNKMLVQLGKEVNAPFIITSDSHYLLPEHSETHDLLMLMRGGKTVQDAKENPEEVWQFSVKNLYYRNAEQMNELWDNGFVTTSGEKFDFKEVIPEDVYRSGIENTHDIACMAEDIELDSSIKLPKINIDSAQILRHKAFEGLEKFGFHNDEKYVKRLEHELAVITKMGWNDYFLIVQDFIKYANDNFGEFAVGPGRGSACGSLVSYCIGITHINPLEYGLLFERFLDESRTDPPDIDIDFDPRCRDLVKKYIVTKYGENKTCSIGTYQSYRTKAVILDVARTLNLPLDEVMAVTKSIDSLAKFDIEEGDESHSVTVDDMDFDHLMQLHPELCKYLTKYPEVLAHAKVLRNQVKNMSTHAGGVIISENDLNGKIPVIRDKEDRIVSAWAESGDVAELSKVGLVKFDCLGVSALTVISDCVKLIEQNCGIKLTRKDIPLSDAKSIRISSRGDLLGIFQLENPGTKPIADDIGLESINDISALTSLIRPGPKDMGMHLLYAKRKRGEDFDNSTPAAFNELLKESRSIIIYQEEAMLIARELAGFTPAETNKLRKGIGKKILSVIMELKEKFIKGVAKTGKISVEEGEKVWHILESFAGYGFNKSLYENTEITCWYDFAPYIKKLRDIKPGDIVQCKTNDGIDETKVVALHDHGKLALFKVLFSNGAQEICSIYHKFLTTQGMKPLHELSEKDDIVAYGINGEYSVKVEDVSYYGYEQTYDLEVENDCHNFILSSGIITSNSHAVAYSAITTAELWLKFNYPIEFLCSLINNTPQGKKKFGCDNVLALYVNYARSKGIAVHGPDVNISKSTFTIEGIGIRYGIEHVKNVANSSDTIMTNAPFTDIKDLVERCKNKNRKLNKKVIESAIYAGALDKIPLAPDTTFTDVDGILRRNVLLKEFYRIRKNKADEPVVDKTVEELEQAEVEMIGVCLSRKPLIDVYSGKINKNWHTIGNLPDGKSAFVFARIEDIQKRLSKKKNQMLVVSLSDDINTMEIFVFGENGINEFSRKCRKGSVAAIMTQQFEDSSTRFFSGHNPVIELVKY